jgi:2-dehydropantoate 2-reductase
MLSAIERGRVPAVDFLNGEIVAHAAKHRIEVPVNARVVDTVHAIARGEEKPSRELLDRVVSETRPTAAAAAG